MVECMRLHLFLWLNNLPLCTCILHFILLSPVGGPLSCWDLVAIVHSAAVSLGAELSVLQYLCLTFQEPPNFSTEAELFYIPTSSNMGELQFSHVFANTHFLVLLT